MMWKYLLCGITAVAAAGCAEPTDAPDERADTPLYAPESRLAVPLEALPAPLVAAARGHLEGMARSMRGAEAWQGAQLAPRAVPLHRPDLDEPAFYELKVAAADGADAGFLVVSTGEHDSPIPEFTTRGATKAEQLLAQARQAGAAVEAFHRLDATVLVAEDARGELVASTTEQIPMLPPDAVADAAPAALGPAALGPAALGPAALGPWSGWPALKRGFAGAFAASLASHRRAIAPDWSNLRALHPGAGLSPDLAARTFTETTDHGATWYECQHDWAGPNAGTSDVNALTAHWDQISSDFRHITTGTPAALCYSGCTPTAAAIIMAWIDAQSRAWTSGAWSRPDMGRAFFRYLQPLTIDELPFINYGYRAPYLPLPPGGTLRAPASVYDYRGEPQQAWITPVPELPAVNTPAADMRRYLLELGMSMGTHCNGSTGNTHWGAIPGLQRFLDDHRIPVTMSTGNNPWGESGFRENIIHALRTTGAPGFIHTGPWNGHTEVVNAHLQCRVRDKATGQITSTGSNYFYLNRGYSYGGTGSWTAIGNPMMSTTFAPKSPWVQLVAQHSNKCADVPNGAPANGLPMQQYSCIGNANQRWMFQPVSDGSYLIRSLSSQQCLDVSGYSLDNNAPIGQWDCHGQPNQRWRAQLRSDGRFQLRSVHSDKCLEVKSFGQPDQTPLVQFNCDGVASQLWDLKL